MLRSNKHEPTFLILHSDRCARWSTNSDWLSACDEVIDCFLFSSLDLVIVANTIPFGSLPSPHPHPIMPPLHPNHSWVNELHNFWGCCSSLHCGASVLVRIVSHNRCHYVRLLNLVLLMWDKRTKTFYAPCFADSTNPARLKIKLLCVLHRCAICFEECHSHVPKWYQTAMHGLTVTNFGGMMLLEKMSILHLPQKSLQRMTITLRWSHFSSLRSTGLLTKMHHEKENYSLRTKACGKHVFFFTYFIKRKGPNLCRLVTLLMKTQSLMNNKGKPLL